MEEEEAEELERVELWRPAEEFGRSGRGTVSGGEGREKAETGPVVPVENTRKLYTWRKSILSQNQAAMNHSMIGEP